jgi:hypothetical protein
MISQQLAAARKKSKDFQDFSGFRGISRETRAIRREPSANREKHEKPEKIWGTNEKPSKTRENPKEF